jgi:hypothetical protein
MAGPVSFRPLIPSVAAAGRTNHIAAHVHVRHVTGNTYSACCFVCLCRLIYDIIAFRSPSSYTVACFGTVSRRIWRWKWIATNEWTILKGTRENNRGAAPYHPFAWAHANQPVRPRYNDNCAVCPGHRSAINTRYNNQTKRKLPKTTMRHSSRWCWCDVTYTPEW